MNPWFLGVTGLLLGANAFFVAMEFALIASRRTRLEALADQGSRRAGLALAATGELSLQLAGAQLGVTAASLGLGAVAEPTFAHLLEGLFGLGGALPDRVVDALGFLVGLAIVVFLHMVLGEMVPKNLTIADPEGTMLRLAVPNRIYVALFRPVIRVLNATANAGTRVLGVEPRDELAAAHSATEIAAMLAETRQEGLIDATEHDLLASALDFGQQPVRQVMLPIDQATTVSRTATIVDIERVVVTSGHSRLLVTGQDHRDIVGFVHAKDLLTIPTQARNRPLPLAHIRQVLVLDADQHLGQALVAMRQTRTHLAVIVDDDGQTVGLAALEDLLEDLVGDIRDETDPANPTPTPGGQIGLA